MKKTEYVHLKIEVNIVQINEWI